WIKVGNHWQFLLTKSRIAALYAQAGRIASRAGRGECVDPKRNHWLVCGLPQLIVLSITLLCAVVEGEAQPARSSGKPTTPAVADSATATSEESLAATRRQLLELLQMSPKLSSFIARDPSLLAEQDYISRNNPELARFLEAHPQIARNPEF